MAKTKLVMFDYDGTIADTFMLTCHIYNEFFRMFNIDKSLTKRQYQELFEVDWRKCLKKLGITKKEDQKKCADVYSKIARDFTDEIRLYPKIRTTLIELRKKYKLAVVSNGFKEHIIDRLAFLDIEKYFDYVGGNEDGEKPSPDPLLKCLEHFNIKSEEAVYIGDMDGDIIAARAAKLKKAIAVNYGYHYHERLQDADVIVNHPLDILKYVE